MAIDISACQACTLSRAHRQVVGRDGREHQAGALGGDDRTAHAERIGRRAGRRADDQSVAVIGGDHLVVHVRFDRDHARALALDDHFIDRIAGRDAVAEVARDLELMPMTGISAPPSR